MRCNKWASLLALFLVLSWPLHSQELDSIGDTFNQVNSELDNLQQNSEQLQTTITDLQKQNEEKQKLLKAQDSLLQDSWTQSAKLEDSSNFWKTTSIVAGVVVAIETLILIFKK